MKDQTLILIAAVARNGVIGRDNKLPWRLPGDLKRFKQLTLDKPIIMGRKTWESLPGRLPRRRHIVVTRDRDYEAWGADVVHSIDDAILCAFEGNQSGEAYVIGGAEIYRQALPIADRLEITEVHADVEGDVKMPSWAKHKWGRFEYQPGPSDGDHLYGFATYSHRIGK